MAKAFKKKSIFFQKINFFKKRIKIAISHFSQFQHEHFWQYLARLNDYRAQLCISCIKNKKYAILGLRRQHMRPKPHLGPRVVVVCAI